MNLKKINTVHACTFLVALIIPTQHALAETVSSLVQAAPIWNTADARSKCSALATKWNAQWKGAWTTTSWGKMSGCWLNGIELSSLDQRPIQFRIRDSRNKFTDECLGKVLENSGQTRCNPYDLNQRFTFNFTASESKIIRKSDNKCLSIGKVRRTSIPKANDTVSMRDCENKSGDSHQTWTWTSAGQLKSKLVPELCLALSQGRVTRVQKCSNSAQLPIWRVNVVDF